METGTHPVLDAELAGCRTGEVTLVGQHQLPRSCGPGQLVLADREFLGVPLWRAFSATGGGLLWRVPANRLLPVDRALRDGSNNIRRMRMPQVHEASGGGEPLRRRGRTVANRESVTGTERGRGGLPVPW